MRVFHEITSPKDPGAGRHEGRAELEQHVSEVKEIGNSAKECDNDADAPIDPHAGGAADKHKVKVEWVQEESDEAGEEEDAVPPENDVAAGIEDASGSVPRPAEEMRRPRPNPAEGEEPRCRRRKAEPQAAHLPYENKGDEEADMAGRPELRAGLGFPSGF